MLAGISNPVAHPGMFQRVECHPAPDIAMIGQGLEQAAASVAEAIADNSLEVLVYDLGLWENRALELDYRFLSVSPAEIQCIVTANVIGAILRVQALLPSLLRTASPLRLHLSPARPWHHGNPRGRLLRPAFPQYLT